MLRMHSPRSRSMARSRPPPAGASEADGEVLIRGMAPLAVFDTSTPLSAA